MSSEMATKAARLLRKQGSVSSLSSSDRYMERGHRHHGSVSTISFMDNPERDDHFRPPVKLENTYQLGPKRKFPENSVKRIIKDVLESYLSEEQYDLELCRQMTKTVSEVIKARVKDVMAPRYKLICLVHVGQRNDQGIRMASRCLWDASCDTFSTHEFRNKTILAVGTVYGIYYE